MYYLTFTNQIIKIENQNTKHSTQSHQRTNTPTHYHTITPSLHHSITQIPIPSSHPKTILLFSIFFVHLHQNYGIKDGRLREESLFSYR